MGTIAKVMGNINSEKYKEILEDHVWPVKVRHFPDYQYFFRMTMPPCIDLGCYRNTEPLTV